MPPFTPTGRAQFIRDSVGKTIRSARWQPDLPEEPGYWVLTFTDGSELSVRLMAELAGVPPSKAP